MPALSSVVVYDPLESILKNCQTDSQNLPGSSTDHAHSPR